MATLDSYGHMQIVDRSKDVIKSGGEWISSIDVENVAVGCPGVRNPNQTLISFLISIFHFVFSKHLARKDNP